MRSDGDVVIVGTRRQKPFTKFPWEWSGMASPLGVQREGKREEEKAVRKSGGQGTRMPRVGDHELMVVLESHKPDHRSD